MGYLVGWMSNWTETQLNGMVFGMLNNVEWKMGLKGNAKWDEVETDCSGGEMGN